MPYRTPAGQPEPDIVIRRYFVTIAYDDDKNNIYTAHKVILAADGADALEFAIKSESTSAGKVWSQRVISADDLYTTDHDLKRYKGTPVIL